MKRRDGEGLVIYNQPRYSRLYPLVLSNLASALNCARNTVLIQRNLINLIGLSLAQLKEI